MFGIKKSLEIQTLCTLYGKLWSRSDALPRAKLKGSGQLVDRVARLVATGSCSGLAVELGLLHTKELLQTQYPHCSMHNLSQLRLAGVIGRFQGCQSRPFWTLFISVDKIRSQ